MRLLTALQLNKKPDCVVFPELNYSIELAVVREKRLNNSILLLISYAYSYRFFHSRICPFHPHGVSLMVKVKLDFVSHADVTGWIQSGEKR